MIGGKRGYRVGAEEAAGGQLLTPCDFVNALDTQRGGPDDNSAQAGHLVAHALCARTQKGGDPTTDTYTPTREGVRRLTPTECERLQGFPDGWTQLEEQIDGTPNPKPDSHRYSQMGNAVSVPVAFWIGRRIMQEAA